MLNLKHRKLIFCYLTNLKKKKKPHIKLVLYVQEGLEGVKTFYTEVTEKHRSRQELCVIWPRLLA